MNILNELLSEDSAGMGSPIMSGVCCIIIAVVLVVMQFVMLGTIDIYTIMMSVMIAFMGVFFIAGHLNQRSKVKNYIKKYQGKSVVIQKIVKELHLTTAIFFRLLGEIKKSKDISFEIDDRTGELIVEEADVHVDSTGLEKIDSGKSKKLSATIDNVATCPNCGRTHDKQSEFCAGCGSKIE